VDTEVFTPASAPRRATRERLGLPTTGALIFFSSRVAPEKDAETLLAALSRLLEEGRDLWLLHRSGGHRDFMETAARFGVAARVIATDAVHPHGQLPDDYRAADLCVQASREEGLGFSPLEALACGTPVVAAAVGGLRETILDGETGWSYPAGDAEALARRIAEALDDPSEAARRAANGRALVRARYDRRAAFAQLREALDDGTAGGSVFYSV
jgi:D-inositol-3-phosphate glycosyltransferase